MGIGRNPSLPDWPRALGEPAAHARIRSEPADFAVIEELGFELTGEGEHDYLFIEKVRLTTTEVAVDLATHAGVPIRAVGFSGRKDRHARTRQWFSVQRSSGNSVNWNLLEIDGFTVMEQCRHRRKLKRGAHRRNRFSIVLRDLSDPTASLQQRLEWIRAHGMPNYFGEQRFGRGGGNVRLAAAFFGGRRLSRDKRSMALSAARSLIFNDVLAARVTDGTWNTLSRGDVAGLEGTGSVFAVDALDDTLESRCAALDIHPTAPLWGANAPGSEAAIAALERRIAATNDDLRAGLEAHTRVARRSTRARVQDLRWYGEGDTLTLEFALNRGSFATALLRELIRYDF